MPDQIRAMIAGLPMALATDLAQALLARDLPAVAYDDSGPMAGPAVERFTVQRGLAVVPVRGVLTPNNDMLERYLGWTTYFGLAATLAELAERADVSAIALDIDSPGGYILGIDAAANAVTAAAAVKPVHAIAAPLAASAAYWIGAQATSLAVMPGGLVGSIGVALVASSQVGPSASGTQYFEMTSTHARAKWPDAATEEGRLELQRSLDESEALFHAAVATGRKIPLADLPARLSVTADPRDGGATFGPADAVARGLADTVETAASFYARLQVTYGGATPPRAGARYKAKAAAALARCTV